MIVIQFILILEIFFYSNNSLGIINTESKTKSNNQFVSVLKYKNIIFYPKKIFFLIKKLLLIVHLSDAQYEKRM